MLQIAYPLSLRHRSAWLLAIGLLAVALHALAGTGLMRTSAVAGSSDRFVAEVCTSHGLTTLDPLQTGSDDSVPATGMHDCCKLCAAGAPALAADIEIGVPPAPTFSIRNASDSSAHPTLAVWTAHPPRGPPARG
jgi:hypothetical protein